MQNATLRVYVPTRKYRNEAVITVQLCDLAIYTLIVYAPYTRMIVLVTRPPSFIKPRPINRSSVAISRVEADAACARAATRCLDESSFHEEKIVSSRERSDGPPRHRRNLAVSRSFDRRAREQEVREDVFAPSPRPIRSELRAAGSVFSARGSGGVSRSATMIHVIAIAGNVGSDCDARRASRAPRRTELRKRSARARGVHDKSNSLDPVIDSR